MDHPPMYWYVYTLPENTCFDNAKPNNETHLIPCIKTTFCLSSNFRGFLTALNSPLNGFPLIFHPSILDYNCVLATLDEPNLCCERVASLVMRLAQEKVVCTQLTRFLEVHDYYCVMNHAKWMQSLISKWLGVNMSVTFILLQNN